MSGFVFRGPYGTNCGGTTDIEEQSLIKSLLRSQIFYEEKQKR